MLNCLMLFILLGGSDREYDATARYNDSLLVYKSYNASIHTLKTLKQTEIQQWYDADAANDRLTACAKVRLKKYNHKTYEPVTVFEREGMGTAYAYPAPSGVAQNNPEVFTKTSAPGYRFTVYDNQTRFLCEKDCPLHIPYVLKYVFDKGRLLFTEKLNPITLENLFGDKLNTMLAEE
jgi:hypothetical protein